ncbi:glycogen/starch/alpha-glucan phosphorylase [gut metagenome]|uniref:glycogen phosphorylase n=1 Tax=gut metagenome TaxID=749906 RepID=J9G4E1_9ZZZZ
MKRLHEYKRQLLCAMSIAYMQIQLHDNPNMDFVPRTFVFGAKAAAGYKVAKRIIELILSLANDINNDPVCKGKLQVYFVENYRVSAAEAIVPAAQVSEQISTAGKEASGTGCMKLMMNGAVTIGTLDGANVEMYERLGDDNMFLFGLHTDEIEQMRRQGYDPSAIVNSDYELQRIFQRFNQGFSDGKSYSDLVSSLLYGGDQYMLIADYRSYVDCQRRMYDRIKNDDERARLAIMNTAESGVFAADRAIAEYAKDIWKI